MEGSGAERSRCSECPSSWHCLNMHGSRGLFLPGGLIHWNWNDFARHSNLSVGRMTIALMVIAVLLPWPQRGITHGAIFTEKYCVRENDPRPRRGMWRPNKRTCSASRGFPTCNRFLVASRQLQGAQELGWVAVKCEWIPCILCVKWTLIWAHAGYTAMVRGWGLGELGCHVS